MSQIFVFFLFNTAPSIHLIQNQLGSLVAEKLSIVLVIIVVNRWPLANA